MSFLINSNGERTLSKLRQIIEKGTNVVGTTTGAALSVVTGSPELGVSLAAIGATGIYQKVGTEIADRWLAPREQARIGGVLVLSVEMLKSKLDRGRTLRDDGFFDTPTDGRSNAEEVLEGVLRKAQTEYEERKLKYLARLWANACIDKTFCLADLNYLVKLAEQLTYRHLTIISIAGKMANADDANVYGLREQDYEKTGLKLVGDTPIVLSEIMALHNLNCLRLIALLGPSQIVPSQMKVGTHGAALHNTMELFRIPESDRQQVVALLK